MDVVLPKLIASLAAISIIFLVYFQVWFFHRDDFIKSWTIAWGMFLGRSLLMFWVRYTLAPHAVNGIYALLGLAGVYFLYRGSCQFLGRKPGKWPLWLMGGGVLVAGLSWGSGLPFWLKAIPYSFPMAAVVLACGWFFIQAKTRETFFRQVAGYTLLVWGLWLSTPPFLAQRAGVVVWGLFVAGALEIWTAISLLVLFFQENRRQLLEVQEKLSAAKEEAEAASQAKTRLIRAVNHDLRSPLQGISLGVELARTAENDSQLHQSLAHVQKAVEVMRELVDKVLDLSRIESGDFRLQEAPFSLRGMLGEVVESLAPVAREKGLVFEARVEPEVKDGLVGDVSCLRRALLNLAGNALKFTQQGEVLIAVQLAEDRGGSSVLHFCVSDTGPGIPEDQQAAIFRAYHQVEDGRSGGGLGLGLYIVKEIVSLMGGEVWVSSRTPCGSEFHFTAVLGHHAGEDRPGQDKVFG